MGLVVSAPFIFFEYEIGKILALQQLEVENRRLHANMTKLQLSFDDCCSNQTLDDGPGREELLKQYNQLQFEVDRWREECIQLHSILAKQTEGLKNVASINYGSHVHLINEVVELVLAFEAQKKINRHVGRYTCVTKIVMNIRLIMEILIESIIFTMICVADMLTVLELKPHIAVTLLPGLPAYILFMYIRHADCQNDYEKVQLLLTATIYTIEKVTKKGHDDIDTMVLWLSNTVRLLHNLKQYSEDKTFQSENTSLQNEQCLQNFDLTEYREVLSDTAVEIYQSLAGHIQEKIEPLVVPAILEHEEISGLTSQIASGKRGRAVLSSWDSEPFLGVQKSLDALLQELNYIYKIMGNHGVDIELTVQIFRQVFYFICAISVNNLLLRKDLCHWSKGMQIRYNLSHLEQWCRDMRLQCTDVPTTLQPIIQAAHLLQARKLDEDVQHVCNMCDKLSMLQATLLMDTKFMFPVRFPFNPSKIHLEDIEVPEVLNLPMLKKV
ncbi:unconventional myosin-Va-like [Schistocerca americana]|uniref:unconventional myosin-Va-like n=1 Tax=Schistocerca americana TaxID=7009 RepID=UPI001F4F1B35|nr:unconventional myosin-Va-like [Schistocerca americana]